MPLKHLGNGKIVALHITEQLQTEKLTLSLSLLYFIYFIILSVAHFRSLSRSVALSRTHLVFLAQCRSLLDTQFTFYFQFKCALLA